MQISLCKQGSPEWFELRKLRMTASHAQAIATGGKGLETYVYEMCSRKLSTAPEEEPFSNKHTERGHRLEPQARFVYGAENKVLVRQVGFVASDEYVGCSPDGLIVPGGGLQIKCPMDKEYLKLMVKGVDEIDTGYEWQMQMEMHVCNAKWWDFVAFNPNFKRNMIVHRFLPDADKQAKITKGIETGKKLMAEIFKRAEL